MKSDNNALDISLIQQTVQHNCAISDARYSREYSLCIYLLRMREFYRWKNKIPLGKGIDQSALGNWVSDTEAHWDEIEETDFLPLSLSGKDYDPFDTAAINKMLNNSGLHYSAGLGRLGQPHFVLARLQAKTTKDQYTCIEFGEELARDVITLPAMTQNKTIYVRHEQLAQLIWQMFDEWHLHQTDGPMARLVVHFKLNLDNELPTRINSAANELSTLLIQHELGEIAAGELLGNAYQEMTFAFHGSKGEMQIRAVRDLLADSLRSWPYITTTNSTIALDFWLAGLSGFRETLFKSANPAQGLYSNDSTERLHTLAGITSAAQSRWQTVADNLLKHYKQNGINFDIDKTIADCLVATS